MRKLGIPTVLDRFIQQAVMQVLQKQWNSAFSQHSYGFDRVDRRITPWPKRSSKYSRQGYGWVIHLDLENFSIGSIMTN